VNKLIVVDYQEGAGGEFMARFLSAHFGHTLEFDQQQNPNKIQKWLNSHSLVNKDWDQAFPRYFQVFLKLCQEQGIAELSVPYHLHKWPWHVDIILSQVPQARFVRINCNNHVDQVYADFQRKVLNRPITEFSELQFLLNGQNSDFVNEKVLSYRRGTLTYQDIFPDSQPGLQTLPSNDVEVDYGNFFSNFDQTAVAYEELCAKIKIDTNFELLSALLERNQKNQQDLNKHLSTP
jgi:hypothetical protein